jgi:hypothetical protein
MKTSLMLCATLIACGNDGPVTEVPDPVSVNGSQTRAIATWNSIALKTTAAGPFSPPREARVMALVSAAVFDAVNSITGRYDAYASHARAGDGLSVEAAVCGAAYAVLASQYPAQLTTLDAARDSAIAQLPSGRARDDGFATGLAVSAAIIALRSRDHSTDVASYAGAGPGIWVPTPPALLSPLEPAWARVTPFFMDSGAQFRPPPPPAIGSPAYIADYREIKNIGAANNTLRSADQTEAARFWIATAPQLWNQVARQVTVARQFEPSDAARVYLLLNLAGADAMIAAWDAKFAYKQWRPITAIRLVPASDTTMPSDPAWLPLITTPPFPDYPAGHTAYGGAAEQVLGAVLGASADSLRISSPSLSGVVHGYVSVQQIADEVTNARVWGGVHWRTSATIGRELGRTIGVLALSRAPRRTK